LQNSQGSTALRTKEDEQRENISSLGAEFSSASKQELDRLGLESGIKVKAINKGKLADIGIKPGFIITRIGQERVSDPNQVPNLLTKKQGGLLIEGYYPNGMKAYYGFEG